MAVLSQVTHGVPGNSFRIPEPQKTHRLITYYKITMKLQDEIKITIIA